MSMVKRTNEEWRILLAEQKASGQTQTEWCTKNGINLFTFRDRASKIKRQDRGADKRTNQGDAVSVNWVSIKPETLVEPEVLPEYEANTGMKLPETTKRVTPTYEPGAIEAAPQTESTDIRITRGGWTIMVTAGFDAGLLAGVLRVVNQVCC